MNPMNEQMNNDKPVSEILPLEEVTQAIIIAAKRVRKPITEVIIVQQIVEELLNGGFSVEATEKLKNIFGTKFCVAKGLTEPTPVPTKKEKKEKTDKEKVTGEPAAVEKKPRKKPAPKQVAENPLTEPMPTNPPASQPELDPIGQSEEPAVVVVEKKPKKKVVSKPVVEIVTTEEKEEQQEPSIEYEEELSAVPLVRQTNHLSPDGFSIDWKPELMEEELSDIDLEDDEE